MFCGGAVADRGRGMNDTKKLRALLVDDHAVFRESVARALAMEPDLEVTPCATIREALQILSQHPSDIARLDHDLGAQRASQFLPAARPINFSGRVLIVTAWVSVTETGLIMRP